MRRIETEADIAEGLQALARLDPRLEPVIAEAGEIPLRRSESGFAAMVSIIAAQQISRASADAILARFTRLVDPLDAATVLTCGEEAFRQAGMSRPKQATLMTLARAIVEGELDLDTLTDLSAEEARERLTAIRGIGPWTADVYLLIAAGHADVFPAGDVALQGAVADALGLDGRPTIRELTAMAESWSPWRSVAARLFWAHWRKWRGRDAAPVVETAEAAAKSR